MYKEIFNKLNSYYSNATVTNCEHFVYKDEENGILSITPIYPNEHIKLSASSDFISDVIAATAKTREVTACDFTLFYYTPSRSSSTSPTKDHPKTFSNHENFVDIFDEISRNKIRRILVNFYKPYEAIHDLRRFAELRENGYGVEETNKTSNQDNDGIDENDLPPLVPANDSDHDDDDDAKSVASSSYEDEEDCKDFILINPSPTKSTQSTKK